MESLKEVGIQADIPRVWKQRLMTITRALLTDQALKSVKGIAS
jgi:hypothetical protein